MALVYVVYFLFYTLFTHPKVVKRFSFRKKVLLKSLNLEKLFCFCFVGFYFANTRREFMCPRRAFDLFVSVSFEKYVGCKNGVAAPTGGGNNN